jgi:hypothetical protein
MNESSARPARGLNRVSAVPRVLRSDCAGATEREDHLSALKTVTMQGGVLGAVDLPGALFDAVGQS